MKKLLIATALIGAAFSFPAFAAEMTSGVVKKIDEKQMKVTIKHEALKNLEMDAMTMVFAVKDPAMLPKLTAGANIKFVADRVNGRLTVTEVQ